MEFWWIYPILGSVLLSLSCVEVIRRFAIRFHIIDEPSSPRKKHLKGIPLGGGAAIFLSFFTLLFITEFATGFFTMGAIERSQLIALGLGGIVLMGMGFLDDKYDLPPKIAIWGPVAASLIAAFFGIGFEKVTNPLGGILLIDAWMSSLITFMWLLVMMYTTKLLDGLDGLASGVTVIGTTTIAFLALSSTFYQPDVALMSFIATAAILGFLVWNLPPASIFLGDGGSVFLGYLLGALAIISGSKVMTALLVMAVPLLDVIFVIAQRYYKKQSVVVGDRAHLHHKLVDSGWSTRQVLLLYYCVALAFGLLTLVLESWQKLIAILLLFTLMLIGTLYINKYYEKDL